MPTLVVFIRGANVGGHRRFRPSVVAGELQAYDVVNVGATGLFVVRKAGSRQGFRAELMRRLPFDTHVVLCEARELFALQHAVGDEQTAGEPNIVRFVSVFAQPPRKRLPPMPFGIPSNEEWYVRVHGRCGRFVFGVYRRDMKTISYLGRLDKALGAPVTTRNWRTIASVLEILGRQPTVLAAPRAYASTRRA